MTHEVIRPITWAELSAVWNELFPLKTVGKANAWRRQMLFMRSSDDDWRESWREMLAVAASSKYLQAQSWFTLDWLIKDKDGYSTRILEGEFSDERQRDRLRSSRTQNRECGEAGDFARFKD